MGVTVSAGERGGLGFGGWATDSLTQAWIDKLRSLRPRVVFTDGDDPRVVKAAGMLADVDAVRPILVGQPGLIGEVADGVEVIDPTMGIADVEISTLVSSASRDDVSVLDDALWLGAALVRVGQADACVGGSLRPSGDVVRAGIRVIGLADGIGVVSGSFLMVFPDGRVVAYGDCAVVPDPTAEELADIAVSTARTYEALTGDRPVVAMLSFSTRGSASHERVDRVRHATHLVRERAPGLEVDGELQFDAAWVEEVGRRKAPDSHVIGRANVLIFPNLDAGNIAYKLTERLGEARAVGPLLQGLAHPINDVSRGCSTEDAAMVGLVSAIQACSRQGRDRQRGETYE